MTKTERMRVRAAVIEAGFHRVYDSPDHPKYYDRGGDGAYTEEFRSVKDRTMITIEWDVKTEENEKDSSS